MMINNRNYSKKLFILNKKEKELCRKLREMFNEFEINPLNIGCVGNSIASGYSKCDEMIPFWVRSHIYLSNDFINFYSFARIRRNEELNILKWHNQNISHSVINQLLIDDIQVKQKRYACYGRTQRSEYEKFLNRTDVGFRDYIQMENNIMVYCGLSGTFTDIFRKGNSKDKRQILKSFKRDFEYLKAFLMQVYLDNPEIQVYVCGLPDIQGIKLTNLFDLYIKKAIKTVPNAVYVKGVSKNIFTISKNQKELDYHYNKPEYLTLLCEIWKAVLDNYIPMKFKNEVLFELAQYSNEVEMKDTTSKGSPDKIENILIKCEKRYAKYFRKKNIDIRKIKKEIWGYYDNNYLSSSMSLNLLCK